MFRAISRYARALGYLVTGRIDAARRTLAENPHVVRATYDQVIEDKTRRIHEYKDAISRLIVQQEQKMSRIRELGEEVGRLEQIREGAAAKARQTVTQMKADGQSMEQIKQSEDYRTCQTAYSQFTTQIDEKTKRLTELEGDVNTLDSTINQHKTQLQGMLREVEDLRSEAEQTVADVMTAQEERQLNDMLSGISRDRTSRELEEMRQVRDQVKAQARVSRELAGTDTKQQEREFLEYATANAATDEFDRLIGLAGETDAADHVADRETDAPTTEPRLPE